MKNFCLITFVLTYFFSTSLSAKVWINEFVQSNIDFVRDDLQEFPDSWIELYNDSDQEVNIMNFTISIEAKYQNGWKIHVDTVIPPKSHLLIYADKASKGLHTNFHLDSSNGGAIYLFDASNRQIDAVVNIPKQPAPNIARGRISDGNSSWAYFITATPGSANTGKTSNTILPLPVFSKSGGIFKDTVILKLSLPAGTPKAIALSDIHYTLDNSEPTIDSPSYSEGLVISETTVVRANLIHPDYLSNRSKVHSYIFMETYPPLPVISISTDSTYLWDEEFGIYCDGNGKYGIIGNRSDYPVNWNNDWRRPINLEYFPIGNKTSVINQLCEFRISGGWSRVNPQKTFVIYGNKRFGIKRFEYDLFKEKPNQEIKSFMLRNSGNDFWDTHFRDAAVQLFMGGKVDIDYQAYQPAIFYLNGNYWGIQNLRERSEEDFILANYATEDIDVIGDWWGELKAGDKIAWDQLMKELRKPYAQRNYQWIMDQIDIDEFINYMILEIYVSNIDFPGNNVSMWRPHTPDGKWRFILKDIDMSSGRGISKVKHNAFEHNTENDDDCRKLFNSLLLQDSFRKKFYRRFAIYMGDILHFNSTSQIVDSIQNLLEPAMQDHLTRWIPEMNWQDMDTWRNNVSILRDWCEGRNVEVYKQIMDFFFLGSLMELEFEQPNDSDIPPVFVNGIRIRDSGLTASYFQNETLELHFERYSSNFGLEIMRIVDGEIVYETHFQQDLVYQVVDNCSYVKIRTIDKNKLNSLTKFELPQILLSVSNNQLQISNLQLPSIISIYDISGKLVTQINTADHTINIPFGQKGAFIVNVRNDVQNITRKVVL